jgi:competence protein ComEC
MLIDGGGRFSLSSGALSADGTGAFEPDTPSIGESVVSEFLFEQGISRIDLLVATHADADHIQGLADAAANFKVGRALFAAMPPDDPDFQRLADVLEARRIGASIAARGDAMEFGGARVEVLSPPRTGTAANGSENDRSLVLRIVYGSRAILFTGDIEAAAERHLVDSTKLAADVVKVAHHGSRTSSTEAFVDAVAPLVAVVPVGRRSPFGHPHREVIERWRRRGVRVLTTGESGTISVSTNGSDLTVGTFVK